MKRLIVLFIGAALVLSACGNNKVEIEGKAVDYQLLVDMVKEKEGELAEVEENKNAAGEELKKVKNEITSNWDRFEGLETLEKNKGKIEDEVIAASSTLEKTKLEIDAAKSELSKLQGDIVKAKDEPIKISAGFYYFGSDIKPGRYKLMAQPGHRGNVFIRTDGRSKVAETFGGGTYGIDDFVFQALDGDEIEATVPVLLYPVE